MQEDAIKRLRVVASDSGITETTQKVGQLTKAEVDLETAQLRRASAQVQLVNAQNRQMMQYQQMLRSQQQFAAANDNVANSFAVNSLEVINFTNHLKQAAVALYAFSPAFRALVNPAIVASVKATTVAVSAMAPAFASAAAAALRGFAPLAGNILAIAGPLLLVKDVIDLYHKAWELGGKKLEEYRQIAERAAAVDLSTTYFQKITKGAESSKASVDDLTKAFQNLQKSSADKLGGSDIQKRLVQHLEAGNFQGNAGVGLLGQANTTEDRFKAIVTLINQAMQAGQRLAAIDIANTAFGPEVADNLRKDSEYLDKIVASADKVKDSQIVSPEDVGRALELQRRYDAAVSILETRFHPIQDLLTAAGVKMQTAWVGIVEAVAQAVDWVTKLVMKINEIPQTFWDFAKKGAAASTSVLAGAIPVVGPVLSSGIRSAAMDAPPVAPVDAYTDAVNRLRAGLQNQAEQQRKVAEANTIAQKTYGDTSNTLDKAAKATQGHADAVDRAINSLRRHIEQQEADAKAIGLGDGAMAQFRAEAARTAAVQANNGKITAEQAAQFELLKQRAFEAADGLARARVASQIEFGQKTAFLSSEDVAIAQQLRGIYGNDVPRALASTEAAQLRVINSTKSMADGFRDVGKSVFTAFVTGKNVMDALVQSLDRFADKLANSAFDNILSGNPAQMGIGIAQAGAAALISAFTGDQKAKKALQEAEEQWKRMAAQVDNFKAAAAGVDLGPLTQKIQSLFSQMQTLAEAADKAKKPQEVAALQKAFADAFNRTIQEFKYGADTLTPLQQAIKAVNDEAYGLQQTLAQHNFGHDDEIDAVAARRVAGLVAKFNSDTIASLQADINTAKGVSYLNDVGDAIAKFNELAAQGIDSAKLGEWLQVGVQKIINDAGLAGSAITDLVAKFPELAGKVTDATKAVQNAAESLARLQSYQDRLFNATNDTSTLEGAVAAAQRQYVKEQADEVAKGGQYINELVAAQQAELANIYESFAQKQIDAAKQAADEWQSFISGISRTITQFLDGLRAGSNSPLSPADRLAAAQSQYNSQLALAQGGDRDALNGITQYASDLMDASKAFFGSSSGFQNIFTQIQAQLGALPGQVSDTQLVINAITDMKTAISSALATGNPAAVAAALAPYFSNLDTNVDSLISSTEFFNGLSGLASQTTLQNMFSALDANGDGQLSKLELIRSLNSDNNTKTDAGNSTLIAINNANQQLYNISTTAGGMQGLLQSIFDRLGAMASSLLDIRGYTKNASDNSEYLETTDLLIYKSLQVLNDQSANWAGSGKYNLITHYREGGIVRGPGTGTSDSIPAWLSNGEGVLTAATVNRLGVGFVDALNAGRTPVMPMPRFANNDNGSVVNAIMRLDERMDRRMSRIERNTGVTAGQAGRGADAAEQNNSELRQVGKRMARQRAASGT